MNSLWVLLLGLALVCMSLPRALADADQTKTLPPRVASVLQWLPEDTETLIVARASALLGPGKAAGWQDYGASLASQGLILDRVKQFRHFDLRLIRAVKGVSDIPTSGESLIIIAVVENVFHFRIFDSDRKMVVDTDEKKLPEQALQIDELRQQLAGLWSHRPDANETRLSLTDADGLVGTRNSLARSLLRAP
jgi:hypothetical protein